MKVLVVCLGNICRSPIAEAIFLRIFREKNLAWTVKSAGTNRYHKGGPADPRSLAVCARNGLDISAHVATRLKSEDFDVYDVILSMATDVEREMATFIRHPQHSAKILNFLDILSPGKKRSVPDPWYEGDAAFDGCHNLIETACLAWVQKWEQNPE